MHDKGGVGKSTLAINLACEMKARGKDVLLVDADPQGSTRDWHQCGGHEILNVIGLDRHKTFDKDIQPFKRQYPFIIVDTPKINSATELMEQAVKIIVSSDCVLLPVPPGPFDVWSSKTVVDLIQHRQVIANGSPKTAFVINREIQKTRIGKEIRDVLKDYGMPVFQNGTCQRIAYAEIISSGKSVLSSGDSRAINEIKSIMDELFNFMGII